MRDTDWRPSKCPVCGHSREATEKPVCRNKECMAWGKNPDQVRDMITEWDEELKGPSPVAKKGDHTMQIVKVEAHRTTDGKIHETKRDAKVHVLACLLSEHLSKELDQNDIRHIADVMMNQPLRQRVQEILGMV